jgi:phage shock protein A
MCTVAKVTSLFRGFQVQDILDCIRRKARGVEMFARNLQDGLLVKNYLATKEVQKMTATTQVQVEEIYEGVSAMDQVVRGLDDQCQEINSSIAELKNCLATKEAQKMKAATQVQVEEIYEGVSVMDHIVRGLDDQRQEIDSNIDELKDFISDQINDALASKNGMFQMLKDVVSGKLARLRTEDFSTHSRQFFYALSKNRGL